MVRGSLRMFVAGRSGWRKVAYDLISVPMEDFFEVVLEVVGLVNDKEQDRTLENGESEFLKREVYHRTVGNSVLPLLGGMERKTRLRRVLLLLRTMGTIGRWVLVVVWMMMVLIRCNDSTR
jgi:hypothetical protein